MQKHSFRGVSKILVTLSVFVLVICGPWAPLKAADHREAPKVDAIAEGDITDVFVFTDPNDASRAVLMMNVNPFANPPVNGTYSFSPDLLYQFKIDNTGDAREDKVIQILFTGVGQTQKVQVFGPDTPNQTGARNALLHGGPSANGTFGQVFGDPSGVLAFAGLRDDPFVFDVGQFNRILNGSQDVFRQIGTSFRGRPVRADGTSGVDSFGGFNLTSIAVSVPKSMIRGKSSKINLWATVSEQLPPRRAGGRTWVQFERMGQQVFLTVFFPSGLPRDLANEEIPEHDVANYSGMIPDALTSNDSSGNTIAARFDLLNSSGLFTLPNGAPPLLPRQLANTDKDLLRKALLPDVLRFDLDLPANDLAIGQFGLQNGRRLGDAVVDIGLQLLRHLADVHFSGPVGNRVALECSAFPACQDRRVLVVLQGTGWIKPDNQVLDFTISGNDRPFLTTFPYIAAPHPIPGSPGTVGFPPQQ